MAGKVRTVGVLTVSCVFLTLNVTVYSSKLTEITSAIFRARYEIESGLSGLVDVGLYGICSLIVQTFLFVVSLFPLLLNKYDKVSFIFKEFVMASRSLPAYITLAGRRSNNKKPIGVQKPTVTSASSAGAKEYPNSSSGKIIRHHF